MTGRCTGGQHHAPTSGGACPCGAVSRHPVAVPVRAGDEEIVAALAEALIGRPIVRDYYTVPITPRDAHLLADELLPVVRRVAEQRAAEELRAAADWGESTRWVAQWGPHLRARAAALTATPNHGRSAT